MHRSKAGSFISDLQIHMTETKDTRVYEVGFLLTPNFSENEIEAQVEAVKKIITDAGASVISEGRPEFIDLAYLMEKIIGSTRAKYRQAYFGWVKFEAAPELIDGLKAGFDGLHSFIRYILLKTDVENTVSFKKPKDSPRRELFDPEASLEEEVSELDEKEEHEKLPELEEEVLVAPEGEEEIK